MFSGWLFDAYAKNDKMVFWIRQSNGGTVRIEDEWSHPIYVATDDNSRFQEILESEDITKHISSSEIVPKYEKLTDSEESMVLQLRLKDSNKATKVASKIEKKFRFGKIRLYNVDVLPTQTYFYEHGIFPTCYCHINTGKSGLDWNVRDNVWSTDYELPQFENIHLRVFPKVLEGTIPRYTDKIDHIEIQKYSTDEIIWIKEDSEIDIFCKLMKQMANTNADFVLTDDGDSFTFPYLIGRANSNSIKLELGREKDSGGLIKPAKEGTSYFSYGKIFFKPSTVKLPGRIHIDTDNSFIMAESGLPGLYELARICRMPFHTASRASIGKCMSSLQFYHADKKNVLIPWKPTLAEHVKGLDELLIADRGGMILEPRIGVHENVAELDFVSLYPTIMQKMNISAETVFCQCCPDSKLQVPGLDNYYRCEKRKGLVPIALEILLSKRKIYKRLRNSTTDTKLREMYNARQTALKWVLVTSFGYLGFNNAKFGRIDAHIAVCAFDRHILIQTIRTAEQQGFKILHAIVDSIWVQKKAGERNARAEDYEALKQAIENETHFDISLEGVYKWIAFVPSKINDIVGVPNRYFGVFEDETLKLRGIEARRHDTPIFFSNYQQLVLNMIAEADTIYEVKMMFPKIRYMFEKHLTFLKERKVPLNELAFTKRTSKAFDEYEDRNTIEKNALSNLRGEGKSLRAGQILKYIITDYYRKGSKIRSIPIELATSQTKYDIKRYCEILEQVTNTVTEPFGLSIKNQSMISL
ncbi:MAG: DNA polymerase domain-containing protein [Nitrososphaeraceae archaeon]